jgi:hypothetical protein
MRNGRATAKKVQSTSPPAPPRGSVLIKGFPAVDFL